MGSEQSYASSVLTNNIHPFDEDVYILMNATRTENERADTTNSLVKPVKMPTLLKSAFAGIWSMEMPETLSPAPRTGHFFCYDEQNQTAFIGYGLDSKNQPIFDLWSLNTLTHCWKQIKLTGEQIIPRTSARATKVGDEIVIFGGYNDPEYFAEIHSINVNTGYLRHLQTTGLEPSPRSSPIVECYNNKIFVWGGFNSNFPTELNILDLTTMEWRQVETSVSGRTAVPHAVIGSKLYSYGGSKNGGLLIIDLEQETVDVIQTIGSEPPSAVMSAGMVAADHYLLVFGGKAKSESTLMYACDIHKMWWFVFYVVPDGETVSIQDGTLSELGLFMLPRISSFAVCYVPEKRTIMAFLGHPLNDPPPLFNVNIGDALPILHLREDMLSALKGEFDI